MTVIIDGINSLSPAAAAKGEADILFTVNFPSVLVIWNCRFANLFFFFFAGQKYFEEGRSDTSEGKINSDGGEDRRLP